MNLSDSPGRINQTINEQRKLSLQRGMLLGSASVFLSILAASVTFPFLQAQRDNLGCDALCYGSMQSVRSGLSLVGNVIVTRLSDKTGRQIVLWIGILASLTSYMINYLGTTIEAMWWAMVPIYLFNHNFSVLKALFADYNNEINSTEVEKTKNMGRLGMAVGVSFMVGPTIGTTFFKDYYQATALACFLTILSGLILLILPTPVQTSSSDFSSYKSSSNLLSASSSSASLLSSHSPSQTSRKSVSKSKKSSRGNKIKMKLTTVTSSLFLQTMNDEHPSATPISSGRPSNEWDTMKSSHSNCSADASSNEETNAWWRSSLNSFFSLFYLPVAQSNGAKLLFFMRTSMALAFSIFMTVWTVTLKERFNFKAKDHAYFMGWIGLCYAISQGILARFLLQLFGGGGYSSRRNGLHQQSQGADGEGSESEADKNQSKENTAKSSSRLDHTTDSDPTFLLLVCMLILSLGRVLAMQTHSVAMVYCIMALVIISLGVVNTAMSSACASIAGPDQVGGLFGILEALESLAGLFGPAVGGLLFRWHKQAPLVAVVLIYGGVFVSVFVYFKKAIVDVKRNQQQQQQTDFNQNINGKNHDVSGADKMYENDVTTDKTFTTLQSKNIIDKKND